MLHTVDPLFDMARQRGTIVQIERLRSDIATARLQIPAADHSVEVCTADVLDAEARLTRARQLAADAEDRQHRLRASVSEMTKKLEQLEAIEVDAAKDDHRRLAEAELRDAEQRVRELSTALEESSG